MTTSTSIGIKVSVAAALIAGGGCDSGADSYTKSPPAAASSAPADPGDAPQPASPPPPSSSTAPSRNDSAAAVVNPDIAAGTRMSAGGVSWEAPPGWSDGGERPMRLATITDGQAEIAINSFPGDVGGILANMNRWRGQVGLPPVSSEAEAENAMTDIEVNGRKVQIVELSGKARMLVAIVPGDGKLYFFKMTGPDALITSRKDAFDRIVRSVKVQ